MQSSYVDTAEDIGDSMQRGHSNPESKGGVGSGKKWGLSEELPASWQAQEIVDQRQKPYDESNNVIRAAEPEFDDWERQSSWKTINKGHRTMPPSELPSQAPSLPTRESVWDPFQMEKLENTRIEPLSYPIGSREFSLGTGQGALSRPPMPEPMPEDFIDSEMESSRRHLPRPLRPMARGIPQVRTSGIEKPLHFGGSYRFDNKSDVFPGDRTSLTSRLATSETERLPRVADIHAIQEQAEDGTETVEVAYSETLLYPSQSDAPSTTRHIPVRSEIGRLKLGPSALPTLRTSLSATPTSQLASQYQFQPLPQNSPLPESDEPPVPYATPLPQAGSPWLSSSPRTPLPMPPAVLPGQAEPALAGDVKRDLLGVEGEKVRGKGEERRRKKGPRSRKGRPSSVPPSVLGMVPGKSHATVLKPSPLAISGRKAIDAALLRNEFEPLNAESEEGATGEQIFPDSQSRPLPWMVRNPMRELFALVLEEGMDTADSDGATSPLLLHASPLAAAKKKYSELDIAKERYAALEGSPSILLAESAAQKNTVPETLDSAVVGTSSDLKISADKTGGKLLKGRISEADAALTRMRPYPKLHKVYSAALEGQKQRWLEKHPELREKVLRKSAFASPQRGDIPAPLGADQSRKGMMPVGDETIETEELAQKSPLERLDEEYSDLVEPRESTAMPGKSKQLHKVSLRNQGKTRGRKSGNRRPVTVIVTKDEKDWHPEWKPTQPMNVSSSVDLARKQLMEEIRASPRALGSRGEKGGAGEQLSGTSLENLGRQLLSEVNNLVKPLTSLDNFVKDGIMFQTNPLYRHTHRPAKAAPISSVSSDLQRDAVQSTLARPRALLYAPQEVAADVLSKRSAVLPKRQAAIQKGQAAGEGAETVASIPFLSSVKSTPAMRTQSSQWIPTVSDIYSALADGVDLDRENASAMPDSPVASGLYRDGVKVVDYGVVVFPERYPLDMGGWKPLVSPTGDQMPGEESQSKLAKERSTLPGRTGSAIGRKSALGTYMSGDQSEAIDPEVAVIKEDTEIVSLPYSVVIRRPFLLRKKEQTINDLFPLGGEVLERESDDTSQQLSPLHLQTPNQAIRPRAVNAILTKQSHLPSPTDSVVPLLTSWEERQDRERLLRHI